jgi:hypothetical protein
MESWKDQFTTTGLIIVYALIALATLGLCTLGYIIYRLIVG